MAIRFCLALLSLAAVRGVPQTKPLEPVIGVLTMPMDGVADGAKEGSYIGSAYARWLEQAGARVVPILFDSTPAELTSQFGKVNGVLFTGGDLPNFTHTQYFRSGDRTSSWRKAPGDPQPSGLRPPVAHRRLLALSLTRGRKRRLFGLASAQGGASEPGHI